MATSVAVRTEAREKKSFWMDAFILTSVWIQQTSNINIYQSWSLSQLYGITSKSSVERNQSTKYLLCFDLVHYSVPGRFLLGHHKCTCTSNHQPAAPAEPGPEVWLELWHQIANLVKAEWRQREQRAEDLKRRGRHWNTVRPQKDHRAF